MAEHRTLTFKNLDEVVAEAERLASGEVQVSGNHSFGAILKHLALTHDITTGRVQAPAPPWYMKYIMIPIMKPFILRDAPIKPGFKLPAKAESFFWASEDVSVEDGLAHLRESVEAYQTQGPTPKHPMFGKMSKETNLRLQCRHAELHLGFVHSV